MSHFTVLVIGDDPEEQLAPFHEYECTGENDEYVQDIDQTEEVQAQIDSVGLTQGLEYFGLDDKVVSDASEVDIYSEHEYGYAIVKDDKLIKAVRRTNPDARWDWYQLGGRWSGFFLTKGEGTQGEKSWATEKIELPPNRVDMLLKKDLDLEGMKAEARANAENRYKALELVLDGSPLPPRFRDFSQGYEDIEQAREAYKALPVVQALEKASMMPWFGDINDTYGPSKEAYIQRMVNRCLMPYAIVKDSVWYAQGEMGWWGMSSDDMTEDEWQSKVNELIESVDDETLLSLYDCHI